MSFTEAKIWRSQRTDSETLFPILPQVSGLARMAAEATHVADGHNIEFRTMEVRSILSKSISRRYGSSFWAINPYRGCEFACRYCYARYTHGFLAAAPDADPAEGVPDFRDPNLFERLIYLKENAAWLLEQELRKHASGGRDCDGDGDGPVPAD